jgi:hypothetical protein
MILKLLRIFLINVFCFLVLNCNTRKNIREEWYVNISNPKAETQMILKNFSSNLQPIIQLKLQQNLKDIKLLELHGTIRIKSYNNDTDMITFNKFFPKDPFFKCIYLFNKEKNKKSCFEYKLPKQKIKLLKGSIDSAYCDLKMFLEIQNDTIVCYCKSQMIKGE